MAVLQMVNGMRSCNFAQILVLQTRNLAKICMTSLNFEQGKLYINLRGLALQTTLVNGSSREIRNIGKIRIA